MRQVYSIRMFEQHDLTGFSFSFGPPAGFAWVLRGVDVVNGELLNNINLEGPSGQLIWAKSFGGTIAFDYASYRGRFVINPGETVRFHSTAAIDVSAWGYQLSLP